MAVDYSEKTLNKLIKCVNYLPETGVMIWLNSPSGAFNKESSRKSWNTRHVGKEAFNIENGNGYKIGYFLGSKYYAHRVCWAIYYGEWPKHQIDHINGDREDNRIINLRDVEPSVNGKNIKNKNNNKSGYPGVHKHKSGKWRVLIMVEHHMKHVGYFSTLEEAIEAKVDSEKKYGFHENHGRITQ